MQLYFATTNRGKVASLQRDLADCDVELVSTPLDIPEIRADETPEIAKNKALYAFNELKQPSLAQDGGFYLPALNGFPKAYVNFALDTIGLEGILKLLEGKDRTGEFRDTLAYMDETLAEPLLFTTVTKGTLAEAPRGKLQPHNWGELHKIFIPQGETKTFSEMTASEMDSWRKEHYEEWAGWQFARWWKENK